VIHANPVFETSIESLPLVHRGKVRDIYAVGDDHLLMIASDRLSAFDVVLPQPLPGKGILLTQIALFWFGKMAEVVPNHLADIALTDVLSDPAEIAQAIDRSMIVKRLDAIPVEAVVRGYLIGSGWKDYQASGEVCGVPLPSNLKIADQLQAPIFTPASKAAVGDHDENISYEDMCERIGRARADEIRAISLSLYQHGADYAAQRGIILADTKFEFGLDADGRVTLMDEILTPDSSRFWDAASWQPGTPPASYDKQFVRDYLETLDWDKTAPGPELSAQVQQSTLARYQEAVDILTRP
jgi:phosphoribosylaminoimidazole-succinocarboxamide synthase